MYKYTLILLGIETVEVRYIYFGSPNYDFVICKNCTCYDINQLFEK